MSEILTTPELLGEGFGDNCLTCGLYAESCKDKPKLFTAADLARAEEKGRREALESLRKMMTYDEAGTTYGDGILHERWTSVSKTYSIDADIFDALLAEGKKEAHDEA